MFSSTYDIADFSTALIISFSYFISGEAGGRGVGVMALRLGETRGNISSSWVEWRLIEDSMLEAFSSLLGGLRGGRRLREVWL